MQKCLGEKCPNHCCSNKFKGLAESLINTDDNKFVQIQLDKEEVKRIIEFGGGNLLYIKDGKHFLKLNDDCSCSAFKDGKCSIYEVRPDVCKLYPYYFDPFCGICIDKNCPGDFDLNISQSEIFDLLINRINLYNNPEPTFSENNNTSKYEVEEENGKV